MSTAECWSCEKNDKARAEWGDGPWTDEPNRVEFEHAGMPCILHRGPSGAWCGYVALPPGHPGHGKDYDDPAINVRVHGGLTYSHKCDGHICHVPKPGYPDDVWWMGFDCIHAGDARPGREDSGEEYRTLDYCRRETESLAEQMAAMEPAQQ